MTVDRRSDLPNPSGPIAPLVGLSEVDLRRYREILGLWWREIVLLTLGTIIIAIGFVFGSRFIVPPVYETSADIIMSRVVSSVSLVESFRTTTEDMQTSVNDSARREALVHLVKSGTIAEAVIAELGELLDEVERNPATLLEMIEAEAPTGTDSRTISALIRITVSADNPEKAAAIANAWARHYVSHINSVYNQVPVEIFQSVDSELEKVTAEYDVAQQALEKFVAGNRIAELQNLIDQKIALRTVYQEAQKTLVASLVDQDRVARTKLFTDLVSAQTEATYQVFNHQVQERLENLSQLYTARGLALRQLAQAQSLKQQIEASGDGSSAGTLLALELLKTQVYATIEGSSLPGGLTVDLGSLLTEGNTDQSADVDALIGALDQYVQQISGEINALSEQLLTGADYEFVDRYTAESLMISTAVTTETLTTLAGESNELAAAIYERYLDLFKVSEFARLAESGSGSVESPDITLLINDLTQDIQSLQATLAAEQSQELVLTQQRDLAWSTFDTLSNKVVELRLARTAANTEVRFGSPAVAPNEPVAKTSLITVTAIAGVAGLIFGIMMVVVAHLMDWRPWLTKNQPI